MTRQEYDKIVDVFALMAPHIEKSREDNWENYIEDEPKDLVVELSIRLGVSVLGCEEEGEDIDFKECGPFSRERIKHFSPEDLN